MYLALHFRPPVAPKELVWYASDWGGSSGRSVVEKETRAGLRYWLEDSIESTANPLSIDKEEEPIYKGDAVELNGLKSASYNGRRGKANGLDPKNDNRIAIQLSSDDNDVKSFRRENVSYVGGEWCLEEAVLRHLRKQGAHQEFFQGLLDRAQEIDILKSETWTSVQELEASCALVTCSSLLRCLGYRDPTAWQDVMQFASQFLCQGGFLMQYDPVGDYAGFGNTETMNAYVQEQSLGLVLETTVGSGCFSGDRELKVFLWKKA